MKQYYNFTENAGGFELVEPIKGTENDSPTLVISNGLLILSASNYGGGTANLSASLDESEVYTIAFDADLGTLSGIDFRIYKPDGSYYDDSEVTNYTDRLTGNSSYEIKFTGSAAHR